MDIIEQKDGRYFLAAWYLYDSTQLPDQDWFAVIFRDAGEDFWRLRYRHKYYNSPDPFDPKDRRSNSAGRLAATEPEILAKMEILVGELVQASGFRSDFIYFGTTDIDAIVDRIKDRPYMHFKFTEQPRKAQ